MGMMPREVLDANDPKNDLESPLSAGQHMTRKGMKARISNMAGFKYTQNMRIQDSPVMTHFL